MKNLLISLAMFAGISTMANADDIECNHKQTRCMTNSNQWTIGDNVGVFNGSGQLVAVGRVKAMREDRRSINITKRHGKIRRSHRFALLEKSSQEDSFATNYQVYKRPTKMNVGASGGMTSMGIGSGVTGAEFTGFGEWRKWGVQLVGRGTYIGGEGEVSRTRREIETEAINVSGLGGLGGVAYTLREHSTIGFRGELGLGFMYMMADVAGDSALVEDPGFSTHLNDGFGQYLRASGSILWNLGSSWHVNFEVAQALVHDARTSTFSGGIIKALK